MRNITVKSTSYYRETVILETLIKTQHGAPYTHEGLESSWYISGIINLCGLIGYSFAKTELQSNQVRCLDQSATEYFINNTSTATSLTGNINLKCFGCRGVI